MATYNGAKYLKEQLDSFVAQICQPDELVICDDGSIDETLVILERFKKEAPFLVRVYQNSKNLGHTQNFSKAIELCQGDIIFLSDQDDVWHPQKIKRVLTTFAEHPDAGYVFSDAILVDENLTPTGSLWESINFSNYRYKNYIDGNQVAAMLNGGNFVYGNSLSFRASFRGLILPIVSTSWEFGHDTWISLLLSIVGARGIAIPEVLLSYRQHTQQVAGAGRKISFIKKILKATKNKKKYFFGKAVDLRSIKDRAKMGSINSIELLDDYIFHLEMRGSLYSMSRWAKMHSIYTEMKSGRYSRYSSSLKSVFKDIFST
ncbi:MAG: glycosyltransferase family 2 protein [Acidovorax soli]|uniref:glycosyltransferase family 2 protein n=1 Tax=Acidovorax soli TaxID=592050 RepID=UPI0026ED3653|nr:glycosyltransferase family 2 protein [Acidovorax soli]MCM2345407.1 glycosyltransferase family 2 protein [Acidovorax soli]